VTNEKAYDLAYTLMTKIGHIGEFPGLDALGSSDKSISTAIIYAINAHKNWADNGDNSSAFGYLTAMFEYGIVNKEKIDKVLFHYSNREYAEGLTKAKNLTNMLVKRWS
jgi:hypothetical protein